MKKISLSICIALLLPIVCSAQTKFGLKIGGQASVVPRIHTDSKLRIPGLNAGLTVHIPLQKTYAPEDNHLYLNLELLYSQEGEKNGDLNIFQDFINLPVLLRAHIPGFHNLYFELGPQVGFKVNESNKEFDERLYGENSNFNLSASGGMGLCFGSDYQFEFGGRLNWGFLDMYPDYEDMNNHVNASLSFVYLFGKNKRKQAYSSHEISSDENDRITEMHLKREESEWESDDEEKLVFDGNDSLNDMEIEAEVLVKKLPVKSYVIYFNETWTKINSTHKSTIDSVANAMLQNPEYHLQIVGYADKGTGNEKNNFKFSRKRTLAAQHYIFENYAVSPDRITIDWKGDHVQPMKGIKNRCVIFTLEDLP